MRPFITRKALFSALVAIALVSLATAPVALTSAAKRLPKAHLTAVTSTSAPKHWILLQGTNLKGVRSIRYYEGRRFWTTKRFRQSANHRTLKAFFPKLPPSVRCGVRVVTSVGLSNVITIEVVVQTTPTAPVSVPTSTGPSAPITVIVITNTTVIVVQPVTSGVPPPPPPPPPPGRPALPTLLVTSVSWKPATPKAGDAVTFSAVVANVGTAATPSGIGLSFAVDGTRVSWVDPKTNAALKPGMSETLTANDGPAGSSTWKAAAGTHTVTANANFQLLFKEGSYTGNVLSATLAAKSPAPRPVYTKMSIYQVDNSAGALGGEFKYFTVTLYPSDPGASYNVGTVTLGCATVSGGVVDFEQIPSYHEPAVVQARQGSATGAYTFPKIGANNGAGEGFVFSHSGPPCGANPIGGPYTIYIQYSGGVQNGVTYAPDTFCAVPVVKEGMTEGEPTQTNAQAATNTDGCPDTGPPTTLPTPQTTTTTTSPQTTTTTTSPQTTTTTTLTPTSTTTSATTTSTSV